MVFAWTSLLLLLEKGCHG